MDKPNIGCREDLLRFYVEVAALTIRCHWLLHTGPLNLMLAVFYIMCKFLFYAQILSPREVF